MWGITTLNGKRLLSIRNSLIASDLFFIMSGSVLFSHSFLLPHRLLTLTGFITITSFTDSIAGGICFRFKKELIILNYYKVIYM